MRHSRFATQSLSLTLIAACSGRSKPVGGDQPSESLFDGRTLAGWHGNPRLWKVEGGSIVGTTDHDTIPENSFLVSDTRYGDFVLRLRFRLRNGNSGIQFRSEELPGYLVRGYQADLAEDWPMGILYEERGRGILRMADTSEIAKHLRPGGWNDYTVVAEGPRIRQEINGFTTVEYVETDSTMANVGVIALQLHAGEPMRVEFKDLFVRRLQSTASHGARRS